MQLPESACSAKLNTKKLDELFSVYPSSLEGLSTTLADVWRGYKENPLKVVIHVNIFSCACIIQASLGDADEQLRQT